MSLVILSHQLAHDAGVMSCVTGFVWPADAEADKPASARADGRRGRASKKRAAAEAPEQPPPANGRKRRKATKKEAPARPQVQIDKLPQQPYAQ